MAIAVVNGVDHEAAINGINLTLGGDLLLYRKVTPEDWAQYPELLGIRDVWMEFAVPCPDVA